jgi:glutamate synthase (ferredoxin)
MLGIFSLLLLIVAVVAIYDRFFSDENVSRNYPIITHLRDFLMYMGPQLRSWVILSDRAEKPFDRNQKDWIKATSHKTNDHVAFGTNISLYEEGNPIIRHAVFATPQEEYSIHRKALELPSQKILGAVHGRAKAWRPGSVINISGLSFGSLSANAIEALNLGARLAGCYHNSGEGGITPYHMQGGDLIFQFGTGYFGCRDLDGRFSIEKLKESLNKHVRGIEIKLSQGAEPNCGVLLPGDKVTPEVAAARGIPLKRDCISPNHHSAFRSVPELIKFVEFIANETGLPVGIKSAVGKLNFWQELALEMKTSGQGPDWITIDGGEGGTGAAPMAFTDHVSLPFREGFSQVYRVFLKAGMADQVVWIGSGKLGLPEKAVMAFALGVDIINVAREAMISIGCVQSMRCHTNQCPTGVTTHNPLRTWALKPKVQARQFSNYCRSLRNEILALTHATGYTHPSQFMPTDIDIAVNGTFKPLSHFCGYEKRVSEKASADRFWSSEFQNADL